MVACPAENTWMRYVGGAIEPTSAEAIEQHLDACASCRFVFVNLAKGSAANEATDPTAAALGGTDPTVPAKLARFDLTTASELVRGAVIDRYVILGTLGRGGMGVVYKAFDPELDRPIALKLVAVNGVGSDADESRARLLREAKTLAQLSHPNVVGVHDVGSHAGDVFVAMEFVAGKTLRRWLDDQHAPREILAVFRAAGAGLAAAHKLGIVHRDFKPENVMVGDDGRVRVLDFGLARPGERVLARPSLPSIKSGDAAGGEARPIDLTRAGAIMGTPAYMAPEQDLGNEVDARTDQFSFCAALYEALFKQRPFEGKTHAELAASRMAGEVRPVPSVGNISSRARRALLRGLRVDPNQRHASMDALLVELGAQRKRIKLALAALALTTLGAGGWAAWVATHQAPSTDEMCATSASEVDRVWTPKRRADLIASLDKLDEHAGALRAVDGLDRYTQDWSARRTAVCKLMMDGNRVENRDDQTSARLQCLRTRLNAFDALVSVLIHAPNPEIVSRVDTLVADLKPLAECDGHDTTALPTEATRERWRPLLKELVEGQTALANGKLDEAERLARSVVQRARASNENEPLAAALLMLGRVQARNGTPTGETKATLIEAVRAATLGSEEGRAVEAWTEIISLAFTDRTLLKDLEPVIFSAELAALRLPRDDERVADLTYKLGSVQLLRGEIDGALVKLEQALADFKAKGDRRKYEVAAVENSIGAAHMFRGEFADARANFDRALAVWKSLPMLHPNLATTIGWYGELAHIQHDFAGAVPHHVEQVAMFEQLGKAGSAQLGKARFQLGYVYARNGECAKALPLIEQAGEDMAAKFGKQSSFTGQVLLGTAHCVLAAGNARKAIPMLERALDLAATTPATLLQVPLTQLTLARALVAAGKDKRRAIELAERAREGFARYPGARADRDVVEAWLRAQR